MKTTPLLMILIIIVIAGVLAYKQTAQKANHMAVPESGSSNDEVGETNIPTSKISVSTYSQNGITFDFPSYLEVDPYNNRIVMYDPFGSKEPNSTFRLTDPNDGFNRISVSKSVYTGEYGVDYSFGPGWEEENISVTRAPEMNLNGLDVTIVDSKTMDATIYLVSNPEKTFTYEITINGNDVQFVNNAEIVIKSLNDTN